MLTHSVLLALPGGAVGVLLKLLDDRTMKSPLPWSDIYDYKIESYGRSGYNEVVVTTSDRRQALLDALETRILVIDGAMGTMIHQEPLSIETDFLGRENCPEILAVTRPDLIKGIHRAYLDAGADIVETDTFGGTSIVLSEFNLQDRTHELNVAAARLAREAADEFSSP